MTSEVSLDPEWKYFLGITYSYLGQSDKCFSIIRELYNTTDWMNFNYVTIKNTNIPYNLAASFHRGLGTTKNLDSAIKYYKITMDLGGKLPYYNLGTMYSESEPRKLDSAVKYMLLSANQTNNQDAIWWLAENSPKLLKEIKPMFIGTGDFGDIQRIANKLNGISILFGWRCTTLDDEGRSIFPLVSDQYYILNNFCKINKIDICNFNFDDLEDKNKAEAFTELNDLKMPVFYFHPKFTGKFNPTASAVAEYSSYFDRLQKGWTGHGPAIWIYKNGGLVKFQMGVDENLLNFIKSIK